MVGFRYVPLNLNNETRANRDDSKKTKIKDFLCIQFECHLHTSCQS